MNVHEMNKLGVEEMYVENNDCYRIVVNDSRIVKRIILINVNKVFLGTFFNLLFSNIEIQVTRKFCTF